MLIESVPVNDENRVNLDTNSATLTFYTTAVLTEKEIYYFIFDFGKFSLTYLVLGMGVSASATK